MRGFGLLGVFFAKRTKQKSDNPANRCAARLWSVHLFYQHMTRRSKLCIACSDLFYKSERAHAAAPPLQTATASLGCGLGPPLRGGFACHGKNIDFNRPFQNERHDESRAFRFGFRSRWSLHPSAFECSGSAKPPLRNSSPPLAAPNLRRTCAAGQKAGRVVPSRMSTS